MQRRVQRHHRIVDAGEGLPIRSGASPAHTASASTVTPGKPLEIGEFRPVNTVGDHDPGPVQPADGSPAASAANRPAPPAIGGTVAEQRAEVGVFPRLDPAMRQAGPLESRERASRAGAGRCRAGAPARPHRRRRRPPRPWSGARLGGHPLGLPHAAASVNSA